MGFRWGTGPVFVYESITASRRWQLYALRSLFVASLLVALWVAWQNVNLHAVPYTSTYSLRELARLGEQIYYGVAGVQVALVLLAAPAATAGAICLDRARGGLTHMFVTDLSNAEIVLGKLAARLLPVAALVAAGLPVLALSTLLGGIIPEALAYLTLVTAALAVFGCSLALTLSVRATKTHEVLMAVYAVITVWLLSAPIWSGAASGGTAPPVPAWFMKLNPFVLVYGPYVTPGRVDAVDVAVFVGVLAVASACLLIVALVRLRHDIPPRKRRSEAWDDRIRWAWATLASWWPSPSLDGNPVLWREWNRSQPSRMARIVQTGYLAALLAGLGIGVFQTVRDGLRLGPNWLILTNFLGVGFGLLILSVTAPTALTEERVRGSLDVLMSTPISTASIVLGKWWGLLGRWLPLAILPMLTGLFVAAAAPETPTYLPLNFQPKPVPIDAIDRTMAALIPVAFVLAHAAASTSVGLAAATWIKQPGRAVGISVAAYLTASVGWIVLVEAAIMPIVRRYGFNLINTHETSQVLICLSPIAGQVAPHESLMQYYHGAHRKMMWLGMSLEVLFVLAVAGGFLGLTLLTFNRCLGRVPERRTAPPAPFPVRPLSRLDGHTPSAGAVAQRVKTG